MISYTLDNLFPLDNQNTIEGEKGSGKTTLAMLYWAKYLSEGKRVYLNFPLYGFWPDLVARLRFRARYRKKSRQQLHDYYRDVMCRCFVFDEWEDLYEVRPLRQRGKSPEDQMLVVYDEASIRLNARTWSERAKLSKERHGTSVRETQFFSQGRKLGFTFLVISQNEKDLDNQYRHQAGYSIRSKNLRKQGFLGFRTPIPLFVTAFYWRKSRVKTMWWPYPKFLSSYYDSWELFDSTQSRGLRHQLPPADPFGCRAAAADQERIYRGRVELLRDARSGVAPSPAGGDRFRPAVLVAPPETVMEHRESTR
jgi:hypothetical protein